MILFRILSNTQHASVLFSHFPYIINLLFISVSSAKSNSFKNIHFPMSSNFKRPHGCNKVLKVPKRTKAPWRTYSVLPSSCLLAQTHHINSWKSNCVVSRQWPIIILKVKILERRFYSAAFLWLTQWLCQTKRKERINAQGTSWDYLVFSSYIQS